MDSEPPAPVTFELLVSEDPRPGQPMLRAERDRGRLSRACPSNGQAGKPAPLDSPAEGADDHQRWPAPSGSGRGAAPGRPAPARTTRYRGEAARRAGAQAQTAAARSFWSAAA